MLDTKSEEKLTERINEYNKNIKQRSNAWTDKELLTLVTMYLNSKPYKHISIKLGRSPKACQQKLRMLKEAKVIE